MKSSPVGHTTLAQALEALREDLAAQPPPPPSVLAGARRAVRRAGRTSGAAVPQNSPGSRVQRLLGRLGWPAGEPNEGWGAWAGAATLVGVLGLSGGLALRPVPPAPGASPVAVAGASGGGLHAAAADEAGMPAMHFVPLVSPERVRALADAQGSGDAAGSETPAWVVTTEMPQERLAAIGLPYDPARAAERVRAELLVAASGEVLAVRLLF